MRFEWWLNVSVYINKKDSGSNSNRMIHSHIPELEQSDDFISMFKDFNVY